MDGNVYSSIVLPNNDNFIHLLKRIGEIWLIHLFKPTPNTFGGENTKVCFSRDVSHYTTFKQIVLIYIYRHIHTTCYMLHHYMLPCVRNHIMNSH